jgi:arylsulfatase A-like enzyme
MDAHTPYNLKRCSLLLPGGRGQRPYPYGFWKRLRLETSTVTENELRLAQRLYADALTSIDAEIHLLIRALRAAGQWEDTILVVTADHGEEFMEHGAFGHSKNLYEETIHVPLLIVQGGGGLEHQRISAQVRQIDIAPTLIELAGGSVPAAVEGVSLLPCLRGETLPGPLRAFSQTNPAKNWLVSLRDPPWKLIWRVDPGTLESHCLELYHLWEDPGERHNLADRWPERVAEMRARLREHIERLDLADYEAPAPEEMDPVVLARLQALGYVDEG